MYLYYIRLVVQYIMMSQANHTVFTHIYKYEYVCVCVCIYIYIYRLIDR